MCGKVSVVNGQVLKRVEQNTLEGRVSLSSGSSFVLLFDDRRSHWYPFHMKRKQYYSVMESAFYFYERHLRSRIATRMTMFSKQCPPPFFLLKKSITRSKRSDSGPETIKFQSRKGSTSRTDTAEIAEDDQVQIAASGSRMVLLLIVQYPSFGQKEHMS